MRRRVGRGGRWQLLRIYQATQRDPKGWAAHFTSHVQRQLGAEDMGTGWSAAEYGRRKVDFVGRPDVEHAYHLTAEVYRLLRRGQVRPSSARR